MHTIRALTILITLAGCGGEVPGTSGDGGDAGPVGGDGGGDGLHDGGTPGQPPDDLSTAQGCAGVFNPDQVLVLELTMSGGDWSGLKADATNSVYYPAQLRCGDEPPVSVGVRRKRSGGTDKPGVKIDINWAVAGQYWHGLRKLSLENGISEGTGTGDVRDVLAEYLAWRVMNLSGAMSSRAAFVQLKVNGATIGAYTNVEVVDGRFLRSRLGDDSGWLFKRSGSPEDGYKTNETMPNPYEADFCFFSKSATCPFPADLETWLPAHLDLPQMIRLGGANALMANTDAPLSKDNNLYFYDGVGGRVYFPWDLDTTMRDAAMVFFRPAVSGGVSFYWDALYAFWEDDYDAEWTALLAGPLSSAAIEAEVDRAVVVGAATLDADPTLAGSTAAAAGEIRDWWIARHAAVSAEVAAHP